jgi:hypothetical protein
MEHKIKVLVQSVTQAAATVVNTSQVGGTPAGQALAKVNYFTLSDFFNTLFFQDVAALQRLVNASIAALRNAANSAPSPVNNGSSNSAAQPPYAAQSSVPPSAPTSFSYQNLLSAQRSSSSNSKSGYYSDI